MLITWNLLMASPIRTNVLSLGVEFSLIPTLMETFMCGADKEVIMFLGGCFGHSAAASD